MATITATFQFQQDQREERLSQDLIVTVTAQTGVGTLKLFVMRRNPMLLQPAFGEQHPDPDEFSHVASPVDLEEHPEDSPNLEAGSPYFRVASVHLRFRSITLAEEGRDAISSRLLLLQKDVTAAETLAPATTVTYAP